MRASSADRDGERNCCGVRQFASAHTALEQKKVKASVCDLSETKASNDSYTSSKHRTCDQKITSQGKKHHRTSSGRFKGNIACFWKDL